jgi:hypothetical protein
MKRMARLHIGSRIAPPVLLPIIHHIMRTEAELHAVAERIAASRRRRALAKAGHTVRDFLASAAERER